MTTETEEYGIIKSRLSFLKFNNLPLQIITGSGDKVSGFVKKFDSHSVLMDESGNNDRNTFKAINYSSIESIKNIPALC
ncbi:RNA chaperone Hfq [Morganella psychrotolerans]|uniref:Uncharacterized protein n=1 Tax=Morganella psychrotolerans TaxID=368603 RepID=A0A5M9R0M5_9GAMM|nr:RNA chaperone Hfq [Morganella psychrotolerans]KAA8713025.1 hypothetical protein F4V73_18085 [Morganella psychrotolerans]OBU01879.1 hypothetical protein AYY16_16820 [Morganella psychrotolerans]